MSMSLAALVYPVVSQYFPPTPANITIIQEHSNSSAYLSYKETYICETTPGVRSFSGYVHLPSADPQDAEGPDPSHDSNVFFWFFESREDPANSPLAIYLAGGPGESSMVGATSENGPCYIGSDSNSTYINPWSWNNHVNILYIDQPNQVGFSYDTLTNGTLDLVSNTITPMDFSNGIPFQPNNTVTVGTFGSQDPNSTANNTVNGARALWHFAQAWLTEFPHYTPVDNKLSIWANSYGGYYSTAHAAYFEKKNQDLARESSGSHGALTINIDTVGITNGCIDGLYQGPSYPDFARNNTYDLKTVSEDTYSQMLGNFTMSGGCADQIKQCRALGATGDPSVLATNATVNSFCANATIFCNAQVVQPYNDLSNRSQFDIAQRTPNVFPTPYLTGFFNQRWIQEALGVPVNFTYANNLLVDLFFAGSGDPARQGIEQFNYILSRGVKVAMMYGDRDYQCNWFGAENISLSAEWPDQQAFGEAGYASIVTNGTYNGGFVRQYGNLSFSRVFEAGHAVTAYQPETAYRIFNRAMHNKDIATGLVSLSPDSFYIANSSVTVYSTAGPHSVRNIINLLPCPMPFECNIWDIQPSCTVEQITALLAGTAIVKDYIVVEPKPAPAACSQGNATTRPEQIQVSAAIGRRSVDNWTLMAAGIGAGLWIGLQW
ncbi:hypothetical protein LTR66_000930 [Elasticomyces elasticus]|nr:hypothetical protein LTR66_000930 [Elasticomyces elasticus]